MTGAIHTGFTAPASPVAVGSARHMRTHPYTDRPSLAPLDPLNHAMPTYHYRCRTCSTELEVRQSFNEDPLTDCPEGCGAGTLRKVFSGVGISFKGSGFYKNDHGSSAGGRKSGDREDSSGSPKESTGGEPATNPKESTGDKPTASPKESTNKKAPSATGSPKVTGSD